MSADELAIGNQEANRVGEVELALRIRGLEPFQRGPQLLGREDIDGRVDLAHGELLGRSVAGLDDCADTTVLVAEHSPVATDILGAEGEHRRSGRVLPVRIDQLLEQGGGEKRRIARKHENLVGSALEQLPGRANGVASPERSLLDNHVEPRKEIGGGWRGDDNE